MMRTTRLLATTLAAGLFSAAAACTDRANPSDFNPKTTVAGATAETTAPAEPEAREPSAIAFSNMGPAPDLENVRYFANTKPMYLQDMKGKNVLVTFFTVGDSLADRKFVRRYNEMRQALAGKNVMMLNVLTSSSIKTPAELARRANMLQAAFPIALDADNSAAAAYKAASLPATYLVDGEGNIIFSRAGEGGTDYVENAVRQKLEMPLIPERD